MLEIEIDGQKLEVPDGSTVMDAANRLGLHIPHFCYHKKLSIAANCRMCLVQVERAPKPLPACATPVTNGMKVFYVPNGEIVFPSGKVTIQHPTQPGLILFFIFVNSLLLPCCSIRPSASLLYALLS